MGPDFDGDGRAGPFFPHGGPPWHGGPRGWPDPPWAFGFPDWLPVLYGVLGLVLGLVLLAATLRGRGLLVAARSPGAVPAGTAWEDAVRRHHAVAGQYAAFECDPRAVLDVPALVDVRVPSTARFVEAFAEATALCTAQRPPEPHAREFAAAVERAERAWTAAVAVARRVGAAGFTADERALVDQLRTLLEVVASSSFEAERRAAFERARRRFAELERRTGWRMPGQAARVLESGVRGALAGAGS